MTAYRLLLLVAVSLFLSPGATNAGDDEKPRWATDRESGADWLRFNASQLPRQGLLAPDGESAWTADRVLDVRWLRYDHQLPGVSQKAPGAAIERITIAGGKVEISGDVIKIDGGKVEIIRRSGQ